MEFSIVTAVVLLLVIGALAGGNSLGELIRSGIGCVFVVLVGLGFLGLLLVVSWNRGNRNEAQLAKTAFDVRGPVQGQGFSGSKQDTVDPPKSNDPSEQGQVQWRSTLSVSDAGSESTIPVTSVVESRLFDEEILLAIREASSRYRIPEPLIFALIDVESGWNPDARLPDGRLGILPMHPSVANEMGVSGIERPFVSVDAGVRYLRWLANKSNGDMSRMIKGYRFGEDAMVDGHRIHGLSDEDVRDYVTSVVMAYGQYKKMLNSRRLTGEFDP